MTTWHKLDVGNGVEAFEPAMKLNQAFMTLAASGPISENIGVFSYYDLEANLITWYFSPEALALAQSYEAIPCEKPMPHEGFGLQAGMGASWQKHFPEYIARRRAR